MTNKPAASKSPYRVIVGIDYGTTYSGVSWVTTNKTSDDIVIVTRWPNHRDQAWKAPSTIAYASENPKIQRNHWGYEVTRGHKQYAWTKLLLDQNVNLTEHDDPLLRTMYGAEGFLGLPPGKIAREVVEDYLKEMYNHTVSVLERELSAEVFATLPMECWVTMPAIWSDKAQQETREAALRAGFGKRSFDSVSMISEPEAAALYALKPYLGPNALDPLKAGEHVLICDCGGGTVDLVTYEILSTTPNLTHREKCVGTGAKCGATAIDRKFVQWMETKFGTAYTSLDIKKRGPGSAFMQSFESQKKNFGDKDNERDYFEIGPIMMDIDVPTMKYDEDENSVKVSRHEMKQFFDPPIAELVKKLTEQKYLLMKKGSKIDRFVLVGGFGDSPYLNLRLKQWCNSNDIRRFYCPTDCQAAIVKGAVIRGLEGIRPTTIIAKRHYGWSWSAPFREGVDDNANSYVDCYDEKKYCRGRMHWAVAKGQELDAEFKIRTSVLFSRDHTGSDSSELKLFSCPIDEAPDYAKHVSVRQEGTISTTFDSSKSDFTTSKYSKRLKKVVYQSEYEVEVDFRSSEGILAFRSFKSGKEAGTTRITFNS